MSEQRQEAARRLGLPACERCNQVGPLEVVNLSPKASPGQIFYMGAAYCPVCARIVRAELAASEVLEEAMPTSSDQFNITSFFGPK